MVDKGTNSSKHEDEKTRDYQEATGRRSTVLPESVLSETVTGMSGEELAPDTQTLHESGVKYPTTVTAPGVFIGSYRLLECLGQGGMGSVWEAEQMEPVQRRVALKLIKTGMDSDEFLRRFEAERQALALMDHPNIARILDAGTTPEGQPFFAMEMVQGQSLIKFCDERRLSIEQRLKIFVDCCSGVQHAHQKGVVHRDLKPGNIIVTTVDDQFVPKVIDFGLAKALDSANRLSEATMQTSVGQVMGTLKYMSPEQASAASTDVDTRTDVFALGAILFNLLLGTTPIDDSALETNNLFLVLERIRDQEPIRPSQRLSRMSKEEKSHVAALRDIPLSQLQRLLVGDLDWIVVKALENDRNQRYPSVSELRLDSLRFLNDEPIDARPPTRTYRVKKFVRKNRLLVVSSSLVFSALVIGIVGTTWGLMDANRARIAESNRAEGERAANLQSQRRLKQIERANEILAEIFRDLDMQEVQAGEEPLAAVLSKRLVIAGQQLDERLIDDPLTIAHMKTQLGYSLLSLGNAGAAVPLFQSSIEIRRSRLGEDSRETLESLNGLAESKMHLAQYANAITLLKDVSQRQEDRFGKNDASTLESLSNLGEAYRMSQQHTEAIRVLSDVAQRHESSGMQGGNLSWLISLNNLALAKQSVNDQKGAIKLYEQILEETKSFLSDNHVFALTTQNNLAAAYNEDNQIRPALDLYQRVYQIFSQHRGPNGALTLRTGNNLAQSLLANGKRDDALMLQSDVVSRMKVVLGDHHPDTLTGVSNLAECYFSLREISKAKKHFENAVEHMERPALGIEPDRISTAGHPRYISCLRALAQCNYLIRDFEKSTLQSEEAFRLLRQVYGQEQIDTLNAQAFLGISLRDQGDYDRAIEHLEFVSRYIKKFPRLAYVRRNLRSAFAKAGQTVRAEEMLKQDVVSARLTMKPPTQLATALNAMGLDYLLIGKPERAIPLLRDCLRIRTKEIPQQGQRFNTESLLGEALLNYYKKSEDPGFPATADEDLEAHLDEAAQLMLSGYEGLKKSKWITVNTRNHKISQALRRLIKLAETRGDDEALRRWQNELTRVSENLRLKKTN